MRPEIDNDQTRKLRSAQPEEPPVPGVPSMQNTNGLNHDTMQASNSAAVLEEAGLDEDEQYEMNSQPQGACPCCCYICYNLFAHHLDGLCCVEGSETGGQQDSTCSVVVAWHSRCMLYSCNVRITSRWRTHAMCMLVNTQQHSQLDQQASTKSKLACITSPM